ncbi:MAG TPA: hypothetical protein PKO07_19810 [Pseudomonadota bacterium]|nr:hypothetical protein [Pseudomonadota bacterium]
MMHRKSFISKLGLLLPLVVPLLLSCKGEVVSPAASIDTLSPQVVCAVQKTTAVAMTGSNFTPLPTGSLTENPTLELPKVFLQQRTQLSGAPGSGSEVRIYDGQDQNHLRYVTSSEMDFDVYPGMVVSDYDLGTAGTDLTPGLYDMILQNPDQVRTTKEGGLAVVPPPTLIAVTPNPACNEQAEASFNVNGQNFLRINGELPAVSFTLSDGTGTPIAVKTASAQNCQTLPSPQGVMLESCTDLTVTASQNLLAVASYRVVVQNPGAASCTSQEDVRTVVIPAPTVSVVKNLAVCSIADTTLQVQGQNFLQLQGPPVTNPTITMGGKSFATTASNCMPIVDAPNGQLCTTLTFTVPMGQLAPGMYQAVIQNPGQDACSTTMPIGIDVVGVPTVTNATPKTICQGGGTINITGTNMYSGGTALIGTVPSTSFSTSANGTMAQAVFSGPLSLGSFPLTVRNQLGCEAQWPPPNTITVSPGPAILFVDPPAIPSITTIQATVYASNVTTPVKTISIAPTGTTTYTSLTIATPNPQFPNRSVVTIPSGLAAGTYDMKLDDSSTCPAFLTGALKVVANPTLTVTSMTPGFGSAAQDTAVVIAGSGFVSTPRAYLSPSAGTGQALALAAVTFQNATSLTAVARAGLAAGSYDLIVVNPDGSFGIKKNAFTITAAASPPPVITSIAPSSFVTGSPTAATITGTGFRTGATLTVTCQDAMGAVSAGGAGTVGTVTATSISATLTGTGVLCIVRVTNQDGTFFDYSAIGVTNASGNLTGFTAATNMTVGRRALAAAAGRPTPVARFVYAIGGDNGADNKPYASVEAAPTTLNGVLGTWFALSRTLPKPLSFQGVGVIGRFLYAVGGFDGTAAVKDVYRAEILNPLFAPQVTDVDVKYNATVGLLPGIYTYRVTAVMGAADANNPNGETLASDYFPIQIPALANGKLQVCIYPATVAGAASYNVYRSPKANDAAGKELLLGNLPSTKVPLCFLDDGTVTPSGASPMPLGSTGTWRQIASLNTARIGAGVGVAQDPSSANLWYVYAVGGNSGTIAAPSPLGSVEFLPVTLSNGGATQTFTTWTPATGTIKPRWALSALPATAAQNSVITVPTDTYLFAASGSTTSVTTLDGTIESAKVPAGGNIASFASATMGAGMKRPGYGGALVNNQMMCFGGFQAGAAATNSDSATLSSATQVGNFNALGGGVLKQPRALQGTAIESAFIYQLGGANAGPNTAQVSTEQTIW